MRQILALQHVPHETLGMIETAFRAAGFSCRSIDLSHNPPSRLPPGPWAGLVVLGGPMNVDETVCYPFLEPEVGWIREVVEAGLPVLGVCLGSQLLAKALGGKVMSNRVKEIGWYEVELTAEANGDPLFAGCGPMVPVFQWHGDTFSLPPGAVHLARSPDCENQAFRYGSSAYGLQFHVEVTAQMIEEWLEETVNRRELAELEWVDPEKIRAKMPHELPRMQAIGMQVLRRFVVLCASDDRNG